MKTRDTFEDAITSGGAFGATPGPVTEIDLGDVRLPLWVMPFDAHGRCVGPETRQRLIGEIESAPYTDLFLFSHGWNNTFERAETAYERFITGYHNFVRSNALAQPVGYKPLLVGIFWPSIDFILPSEKAPQIAAMPNDKPDEMELGAMIDAAKEPLDAGGAVRLEQLATRPRLTDAEARELAALLAAAYPAGGDELNSDRGQPDVGEVMATWQELAQQDVKEVGSEAAGPESFGVAAEDRPVDEFAAAGLAGHLDPRTILRAFTVYKMKDRAGLVGSVGVAPLLRDLLTAAEACRVHLVGHSFGCRLLLAAICAEPLPRQVRSLLLLQPAINYLCFAPEVPKVGKPGGFRSALDRVEQPILSTFSSQDRALHDFFHIAVRRHSDLGELKVAALGQVPSLYAALGGWGPGELAAQAHEVDLAAFPSPYGFDEPGVRVYALNGDRGITGHSDVVNDWTYWALYNQVTAQG